MFCVRFTHALGPYLASCRQHVVPYIITQRTVSATIHLFQAIWKQVGECTKNKLRTLRTVEADVSEVYLIK